MEVLTKEEEVFRLYMVVKKTQDLCVACQCMHLHMLLLFANSKKNIDKDY